MHKGLFLICLTFFNVLFAQEIQWEKNIGGSKSEYLSDIIGTPDNGFLLAGSSYSGKSGTKAIGGQGDLDYFIWKINENGDVEWQNSFGGLGSDELIKINSTWEGGYILAGMSNSGNDGDKKSSNYGLNDFWIVKINPFGEEEWQLSIGGKGNDMMIDILETYDRGFLIAGTSDSDSEIYSNNVLLNQIEENKGNSDFWVIKISEKGAIEWQRTLGGKYVEELKGVQLTKDQGYILSGNSNSPQSGDKISENIGQEDFWILKLNEAGEIEWEKSLGGEMSDNLTNIIPTNDNGFIIGGTTQQNKDQDINIDWWIMKMDVKGDVEWEKTIDIGSRDVLVGINKTKAGNYLLSGFNEVIGTTNQKDKQDGEDYIAIKIDETGKELWRKKIGGKSSDRLNKTLVTRDGGYILAGTSDSKSNEDKKSENFGREDFWVVKLLDSESQLEKIEESIEVYPNPARDYVNILIHQPFKSADLQIVDMAGAIVQENTIKQKLTPINIMQLSTGIYILKIKIIDQMYTKKVIKL
ncbi:T9SS type A sorting domain-containing protein [Flavobacteriaceae bacterium Ap0902]|nr:T9SS type A sorting domain-containing protein [Flavobacteriaceae bacterium Ap0902]